MLLLEIFFKFFYMICWTRKLKCVVHISSMHSRFELRCVIFWPDFFKMDFLKQIFLNISIYTSIIDIILFPKFFCDPVFVFYESFIRDTLNIGRGSYDYLWSWYSLGKSQNTWEASVTNLESKESLFTKRDKPASIRNQFFLELRWFF